MKYRCKNCKRKFVNAGTFGRHKRSCKYTEDDLNKIRELYDSGSSEKLIMEKGYSKNTIRIALRKRRRSRQEANFLMRKLYPESFKPSDKTRKKISISQRKYYKEHPDKLPYLQRHSSNKSPLEDLFEKALIKNDIKGWVRKYRIGLYEYDFAFPLMKIDVEIDGHTHNIDSVIVKDRQRDEWSKTNSWTVVRFNAKYVRNDVQICIDHLRKILINRNYNVDEIDKSFLMLRTQKERRKEVKQQRLIKQKQDNELLQKSKIEKILSSSINFSLPGWVGEAAKTIEIRHQKVKKWMTKYMPEFYEKCYQRQ